MPTISHGSGDFATDGYVLVSQSETTSPDGSRIWVREFLGTQAGMDTLRALAAGLGTNVRFVPGGQSSCSIIYPFNPGSTETPVDFWRYEEVATQPNLYTHPNVAPVLTAAHKAGIENALRDGVANPYASYTSGVEWVMRAVFDRMQRGTEAWEANRPFIQRTRSFSGAYYSATPTTLTLTSTVYSRSSLISTFSIPSDFQPRIPVTPSWTAPSQTTWGWRKGPQSSEYNRATRRWEETSVFEGNFWDNALYTFV